METISRVLMGIVILFFCLLTIKQFFRKKNGFCVICFSISLTWIFLLILYFSGFYEDKVVLALLMGMSITGFFYYTESRVKNNNLKIFRLPFILSLFVSVYSLLEKKIFFGTFYFLVVLWVVFFFIFLFRNNSRFNYLVNKLIECCKRW